MYILVEMPHKRSCTLKNHHKLVNLAEKSPDNIFMEDIVCSNYANRPDHFEVLCPHNFVANYDSHSNDSPGRCIYRNVTKSSEYLNETSNTVMLENLEANVVKSFWYSSKGH